VRAFRRRHTSYGRAQEAVLTAAAKQLMNKRRSSLGKNGIHSLQGKAKFDSYKFDGDESKVHLEWRANEASNHRVRLQFVTEMFVVAVGLGLGFLVGGMNLAAAQIHSEFMVLVDKTVHPNGREGEVDTATGFVAYTGLNVLVAFLASLLVWWAPAASNSGLPKLKSFLNGTYQRDGMISVSTLVARIIGITLVTSTGLPLGRDGPFVHIGAMFTGLLTRANIPGMRDLLELTLPVPQREWIAMGAVAGVAAAFNAPIGGILYSFEEVCSHWSHKLTWRSFVCAACVSMAYNLLVEYSNGKLHLGFSIRLGLKDESFQLFSGSCQFLWIVLLGAVGGVIGGAYNRVVFTVNKWRQRLLHPHPVGRVAEAVIVSFVCFAVFYVLATEYPCTPCPHELLHEGNGTDCTHVADQAHASLVKHACPVGEYNEMATLLFSSQERMIEHLFSRQEPDGIPPFSVEALSILIGVYFVLSAMIFGIAVPGDNFFPGIALGAMLGRLVGELLEQADMGPGLTPGAFALIGAGAVLSGMTRMTITLAAILTEVAHDVKILPALIVALAIARIVGNRIALAFDEGMMHLQSLPYLEEAPPDELTFLMARNAMATPVTMLASYVRIRDVVDILNGCSHNGFPVVYDAREKDEDGNCSERDVGSAPSTPIRPNGLQPGQLKRLDSTKPPSRSTQDRLTAGDVGPDIKLGGMVLRRQLLLLLKERAWERMDGGDCPTELANAYVNSFASTKDDEIISVHKGVSAVVELSESDLEEYLDLRPFCDPAPFVSSPLMPLTRVYRMFNEIGARHLPVIDVNFTPIGMICRKDLDTEKMVKSLMESTNATASQGTLVAHGTSQLDRTSSIVPTERRMSDIFKNASFAG